MLQICDHFLGTFLSLPKSKGKSLTGQDRGIIEWMDGEIGRIETLLEGFI